MPFTFSHPAIVLSATYLPKRWYSLTGLVVGSVVPDFEYFFRMNIQSIYSHTLWGILYFDLPIGLLLSFIFHSFVRNRLIENTPLFISKHLALFTTFKWAPHFRQNWFVVVISIIIGAFSHILWDSFTHGPGFGVHLLPFLRQTVMQTATIRLPLYTTFQHISSLIGMLCLLFYVKKLPIDPHYHTKIDFKYWGYIFVISAIGMILRVYLGAGNMVFGDIMVSLVSCTLFATLLVSIIMGRKRYQF